MTGFARQEGGDAGLTWSWEAKSVNSRSLDIRCRVPQGYESLDAAVRGVAPQYLARGNLQLTLTANRAAAPLRVKINRDILDQVVALTRELEGSVEAAPPRLDGLLAIRGVIEAVEEEETAEQRQAREAAMQGDLEAVLRALAANRRAEGARLGTIVEQHLASIAGLVEKAAACAAAQPEALRVRLRQQVEELLGAAPSLSEERLAQEAALLVTKADVREELDRLIAHVAAARELLAAGGAVG
ncbi:MAG: YicC family protein, partial [Kiloniellales bacterium]